MAVKKRGLGRGLDELLSSATANTLQEQAAQADASELQHLSLNAVQPGKYQPRGDMDQAFFASGLAGLGSSNLPPATLQAGIMTWNGWISPRKRYALPRTASSSPTGCTPTARRVIA